MNTHPPCIVLSRRRTGAQTLFRLLGDYLPGTNLGSDPFNWSRQLGMVSRAFHEGRQDEARALLDEQLGQGAFFSHHYESESREFNAMLFRGLADSGCRVVLIERRNEVERLFSLIMATHFGAWEREAIESLRNLINSGNITVGLDMTAIRRMVADENAYSQWFRLQYPGFGVDTFEFAYEDFFHDGIGVLDLADRLFGFVGLGARSALLNDSSLLRFSTNGGHFMKSLLQYSQELRELYAWLLIDGVTIGKD